MVWLWIYTIADKSYAIAMNKYVIVTIGSGHKTDFSFVNEDINLHMY